MWLFAGNVRLEIVRPYARRHALSPYTPSPSYPPVLMPAHAPARTCVCIYIVCLPSPFVFLLKIMFCNLFVNQSFMKKF